MSRYNSNNNGTNLLQNYFSPDSAIYRIIEGLQQGHRRFNAGLVNRARDEVQVKGRALDASTYPFAQGLYNHLHGHEKGRIVMLVEGVFYGETNVASVIPIDITDRSHVLFRGKESNTTIDDRVTLEETRRFIREHRKNLAQAGAAEFGVDKSRFFYFREADLSDFLDDGELDMIRLVPLISPTKGYVVLDRVDGPTFEAYMESSPPHVSYRLKHSLMIKLLRRLVTGDTTQIADWVGHRPVVPTMEDVENLEAFLRGNPRIGRNSGVEYLYTKDYYDAIKASGFKSKTVVVRVATRGFEPCIREIQIVDKAQYYANELESGKTSHDEHEKKVRRVPRRKRSAHEDYARILGQIFGTDTVVIPIS